MSASGRPPKPLPESVALAAEKARSERMQRLKATLDQRIENPIAAIDALMAEAGEGVQHADLWEQLHSAAMRDGREAEVADAYVKCASGPRMKRLAPEAQADVLMHAADFFQGVRGDAAAAEGFLERVLSLVPTHADAFHRLERRLEKLLDARRLLELYATVADAPPKPVNVLATQAWNRMLTLGAKDAPLSDDACKKLLALVPTNPRLLDALEGHCRATKRAALACALIEQAILFDDGAPPHTPPPSAGFQGQTRAPLRGGGPLDDGAPSDARDDGNAEALVVQRRQRLLELYMGEANMPAAAMPHVEKLLERDANDAPALKVAEKLLSTREVASRAAAALSAARRARSA